MKASTVLQIAYLVSQESKCCSWKVGAVIEKNGRIISTGYNGSPSGGVNCCDHAAEQGWIGEIPYKSTDCVKTDSKSKKSDCSKNIEQPTLHGLKSMKSMLSLMLFFLLPGTAVVLMEQQCMSHCLHVQIVQKPSLSLVLKN